MMFTVGREYVLTNKGYSAPVVCIAVSEVGASFRETVDDEFDMVWSLPIDQAQKMVQEIERESDDQLQVSAVCDQASRPVPDNDDTGDDDYPDDGTVYYVADNDTIDRHRTADYERQHRFDYPITD